MKLLALDTSYSACSIALLNNDQMTSRHILAPMQQTKIIFSLLDEVLSEQEIKINQVDAIVFGSGPGSFSGLRIAASVAQGLAFGANLPVIAISSLAALAQSAYEELGWRHILVGMDAKMQQAYFAAYSVTSNMVKLIGEESVCTPQTFSAPSDHAEWYGVGDAWDIYKSEIAEKTIAVDSKCLPKATAMLSLAREKFTKHQWLSPEAALPCYLRNNVATKPRG